jgi:hypothetical protein
MQCITYWVASCSRNPKPLSYRFLDIKKSKYRRFGFIQKHPVASTFIYAYWTKRHRKRLRIDSISNWFCKTRSIWSSISYIQADHFLMGNTSCKEITGLISKKLGGKIDRVLTKFINMKIIFRIKKYLWHFFPDIKIIASGSSLAL